ncbi:nitroreductase [Bacillus sp. V3B]|uniref:nitroreductase family protein n=1 Tax=Bacillus sp. V3B TaxID=2804915 RepID=UPI00210EC804|nr:nitroreductase [Bacillus sp. V3B]MCQ6277457.1 nitroreductase [Bacillus sp. V3B]
MDIFKAIFQRRTIGKVKPDPIEKEKIEKLLEAAIWAPNHYHTEPWKFFVLTGDGRRPLGRTLAEIAKENMDDPTTEENQEKLKKAEEKPFRAPVIITVAVTPSDNPKVIDIEEVGAVNAAIQNMLLAAHALGLGAIWRTGKPAYHSKMKKLFGLRERDEVLGFIYIGYPDIPQREGKRVSFTEKTKWIEVDTTVY